MYLTDIYNFTNHWFKSNPIYNKNYYVGYESIHLVGVASDGEHCNVNIHSELSMI